MKMILPRTPFHELSYLDYREMARDCDLLLWTPTSWFGRMIAAATGGPFSHVSAATWWEERLMSVGYEERKGGSAVPLRNEVLQHPGVISVFRIDEEIDFEPRFVKARMINDLGFPYSWTTLRKLSLLYLPVVRWLRGTSWMRSLLENPSLSHLARSSRQPAGRICSQHVARSFAEDDVFFIHKPLAQVTPNDIALSETVEYLGTLVLPEPDVVDSQKEDVQ